MKPILNTSKLFYFSGMAILFLLGSCLPPKNLENANKETITTNINGKGIELEITFDKGKNFNHPSFVFWVEDMQENYIQTLYVTKAVATGIYGHGDAGNGEWLKTPGPARRPAILPYWLHKRGVKAPDGTFLPTPENPVPDAYTGATPAGNFTLKSKTDSELNGKFRILFEINQAFDYNEFWTTDSYAGNKDYKTSAQPSVVYAVTVDLNSPAKQFCLNPVGHGNYAGENGLLYTDLSTITTANQIVKSIVVNIKN